MRTVAIPPFGARVPDPELGWLVAEALRREVASGTALRLASADSADAVLVGTIEAVEDDPASFRSASGRPMASGWMTRVRAVAVLRRAGDVGGAGPGDRPAWKLGPVEATVSRVGGGTPRADAAARERALRTLAVSLAKDLYRELVGRGQEGPGVRP